MLSSKRTDVHAGQIDKEEMVGISAFTIADWFVAHNNAVMRYNSADEISNLKVQKLLYYAQGCALVSFGKALFDEDIVAWKHGPVVRSVYDKYQKYGRSGITEIPEYPETDVEVEKLLINTYNAFAKYSAWELANLTHKEDPWRQTSAQEKIPTSLIRDYFLLHYSDVNKKSNLTENIDQLREFQGYKDNWDGEGAMAFGTDFIRDVIELVSTLPLQPDVGATGRGSIDLEYGSAKAGQEYLNLEIYEKERRVHLYKKNADGAYIETDIEMEDVNEYVQQL